MKRCILSMPNPMADYFRDHRMDDETELRSYCMMLYPLLQQGKLTHKQVARLLNVDEEVVNAVYDSYELPHRYARSQDFAESEERVNQAFCCRYAKHGFSEKKTRKSSLE